MTEVSSPNPPEDFAAAKKREVNEAPVDPELQAISEIVAALSSLTGEQRTSALAYVFRRFDAPPLQYSAPMRQDKPGASHEPANQHQATQGQESATGAIRDIRTLREAKAPKSGIQMAALVAYYVSELAPEGERKQEITKSDVERYFKMAGFSLPADAGFTLNNAKNAGYLDSAKAGHYKLNPVGYNLVAHRMGTSGDKLAARGAGRKGRQKRGSAQAKNSPRGKK